MVGVSHDVGHHEQDWFSPSIATVFRDKVSDLWQCAEFMECFHLRSCVIGVHDTCKPRTLRHPSLVLGDIALVMTCLWAWWMPVTMMILLGFELR